MTKLTLLALMLLSSAAFAATPKGSGKAPAGAVGAPRWRHAPPAPPGQQPKEHEQWDTPVDHVPDWNPAEADDASQKAKR